MIEKAKVCGGHSLSGAVMRPEPLLALFADLDREQWRREGFAFGEVQGGRLRAAGAPHEAADPDAAAVPQPR